MKLTALTLAFAALLPLAATASTLTYKLDLARSNMDEITAYDICGLPKEFRMDSRADLATEVIQKVFAGGYQKTKIQMIQATSGSLIGGDNGNPYEGDYRVRVALVNLPDTSGAYKGGVVYRVEINTFGSTAAPKGFTVDTDLLNYRESAELGEDSACTGYKYYLS